MLSERDNILIKKLILELKHNKKEEEVIFFFFILL